MSFSLTGVYCSDVGWGDYDNDGDLDILLTGNTNPDPIAKVYQNGSFADISAPLSGVEGGKSIWGDYDNDGDLDILLTGSGLSKIYKNNNGDFVETSLSLSAVSWSSSAWGDYDNDGDLDLLLTGLSGSGAISKVYQNNEGTFSEASFSLLGVSQGSVAWGDYDNDGDLDILLSGHTGSDRITKIYRNGGGSFDEISTVFAGVSQSALAWGDYDNDGDLDVLLTGVTESGRISKIYRNNAGTGNTIPSTPSNLNYSTNGRSVTISWDHSTDNQTSQDALTYNLYLGNSLAGMEIASPMSQISTGFRKVAKLGNTYHKNSWTINNLSNDTYYWSVQAIDNAFAGSAFASEQSFTINVESTPPAAVSNLAVSNISPTSVTLTWTAPGDDENSGIASQYDIRYYISTITDDNWDTAVQTTGLTEDTNYYFAIKTADEAPNWSGISNSISATPEKFTEISTSFPGVEYCSVAWGDYDDDADIDILLSGKNNSFNSISKIYQNDSGNFTDITTSIAGADSNSVAWGDYDNDGDLDILITYNSTSRIYRNDAGTFVDIQVQLPGCWSSSIAWGDYDNDGDLDILMTGYSAYPGIEGRISKIYRNDNGDFVDISASLTGVKYGSVSWGDYDNDGDLDILLIGNSESGRTAKVYRNNNGTFEDISAGMPGTSNGAASWGDYDNDGALDILISGQSDVGRISRIYRNNNGVFQDISAAMIGLSWSSAAWGDVDNDGDLDVLLAGNDDNLNKHTKVYRNDSGTFTDISATMEGVGLGSAAWGDYDNDGDLDILLAGRNNSGTAISKLYRNNIGTTQAQPSTPINLNSSVAGNTVTLNWNQGSLLQTLNNRTSKQTGNISRVEQDGQNDLTFNIRVGTSSGGVEVSSPMADMTTGYRKLPQMGNANQNTNWIIKGLPAGTYYWSLQSIDNAFIGSGFAAEQTFTITTVYNDTELASQGSTISFNEGGDDPGDGHGVDMDFTSITGSGDVTVHQVNEIPPNAPCINICDFQWNISKDASITAFSVDITFHHTDTDVSGYTESAAFFGIAKFNSSTNTWQWLGGTVDAANNKVTVSGVTSFSTFALFRRIFGDITGYGYVDAADLQRLGDCWHQTNSEEFTAGSDARFFNYNKNTDGGNQIIDAADLQVFGDCWHNGVEL